MGKRWGRLIGIAIGTGNPVNCPRKVFLEGRRMIMSSPNFDHRRKHPRVDVEWPVTMMTPEGDMDGTIENISAGGAYIRCGTLLSKNDLFIFAILIQEREESWIGAEVVWIDIPLSPDTEPIPVGMGIRFTSLSAEDLQFLTEAVNKRS
jgi:hypothetical protein